MKAASSFLRACAALFILSFASMAKADVLPVNAAAFAPNVIELQINETSIDLQIEVLVGDLEVFSELVPSSWMKSDAEERATLEQRLEVFSREKLIVKADGKTLRPELRLVEPRRRLDRRSDSDRRRNAASNIVVAEPPKDDRVMYVELTYRLPSRPSVLELTPPLEDDGRVQSTIGFITFHTGVPVTDFWYLSGSEKLVLNWEDPWYSAFENRTLKRHHNSSALTFLYVDPREVRHETLIRVRDLATWVELDLPSDDGLTAPSKTRMSKAVKEFFLGLEPILIDGRPHRPTEARIQFLEVTPSGLQTVNDERTVNANTALIGVILSYPVQRTPDQVEVSWTLFNNRLPQVSATLIDASGPIVDVLTTERSRLVWRNTLLTVYEPEVNAVRTPAARVFRLSFVSLALIAGFAVTMVVASRTTRKPRAAVVFVAIILGTCAFVWKDGSGASQKIPFVPVADELAAEAVLSQLLKEIGTAYYEVDGERRRAAMNKLVSPEVLSEVIREIDRGLAIRVPGDGLAKTDKVTDLNISEFRPFSSNAGFAAVVDWKVLASASHFGHEHLRNVHFRALADVVYHDGAWRLSGLTVLEANQVDDA